MKWLTTILCLLAFHATAQELPLDVPNMPQVQNPDSKIVPLAMFTQCATTYPDEMLKEKYGEIGFIDGEGNIFISPTKILTGNFRMFLNPEHPNSFSIVFEVGELSCLIMSGQGVGPMVTGDEI